MSVSNSSSKTEIVRSTILATLAPRLSRPGFVDGDIDASTPLYELGLIDSKDLLDIILEVEERCGVAFNPEHIDFETGITLGSLIRAFTAT
jgi:acyl carrier protein